MPQNNEHRWLDDIVETYRRTRREQFRSDHGSGTLSHPVTSALHPSVEEVAKYSGMSVEELAQAVSGRSPDDAWKIREDEIETLRQQIVAVLDPPDSTAIAEVPIRLLATDDIWVHTWRHESEHSPAVVISDGTWDFVWKMTQLLLEWYCALSFDKPKDLKPPSVDLAEPMIASSVVFTSPDWARSSLILGGPLSPGHQALTALIFRTQLLFLLCHEFSHILLHHDEKKESGRIS